MSNEKTTTYRDGFYGTDKSISRRNEVYLRILNHGLHRMRDAAFAGDFRHCEVESDHLHNIPSYVALGDHANHLYYLAKEVPFYLSQADLKDEGNLFHLRMYISLWQELEGLVPVDGSPWAQEWRAMKAGGWNYGRGST